MLELGAGYGRWGVRGALAAKQCGICDIDVRFVEAEPQHAAWLADAIALNQLQDIKTTVIEAAVSYAAEPVPFAVTYEGLDARSWYGQAIWVAANQRTARTYFGRPVYRTVGDVDQIMVEPVTFESIIADVERVDHVDMDLQGAERELIPAAIATFSEKVARVHIGTHGAEIEDLVRRTFLEAGWTPGWDFAGLRCQDTPYGPIEFEDGVQTWRNPRLI
jgi:FkbM family methyltransferase